MSRFWAEALAASGKATGAYEVRPFGDERVVGQRVEGLLGRYLKKRWIARNAAVHF